MRKLIKALVLPAVLAGHVMIRLVLAPQYADASVGSAPELNTAGLEADVPAERSLALIANE